MADRTQRRIAGHEDIATDDPFAELTRIMGFDPREPVAPRAESRLVAVEPAAGDDIADDFDIDLEKELMGEFGTFDEPPAHAATTEAAAARRDGAMEDDMAAALEQDFSFDEDFAVDAGHTLDEPVAQDFDTHFDQIMAEVETDLAVPAAGRAPAPAVPDSLEDELNELLGRMSARPAMADPVEEASAAQARASGPAEPDLASADELNWALDMASTDAEAGAGAVQDFDEELLADLEASGFDEASAFEGPAGAETGASPAAAGPEELEDPIESLKWLSSRPAPLPVKPEPVRMWGRGTPVAPPASFQPSAASPRVEAEASAAPAQDAGASCGEAASAQSPAEIPQELAAEMASAYEDLPDLDIVDVPERVVALEDDLDIPDVAFDEGQAEGPALDDLDAEFASLLSEMNAAEPVQAPVRAAVYEDEPYVSGLDGSAAGRHDYAALREPQAPVAAAAAAYAAGAAVQGMSAQRPGADMSAAVVDPFAVTDDLDFDPDSDEAPEIPPREAAASGPGRRALLVAGVIGAVAVVGGLGALALSFGGKSTGEAPAIVKADNQPIKVKPENPGGTVIPNQDNKVYDAVAKGAKATAPAQQELVTQAEEPVDVTAQEPAARVVEFPGSDAPQEAAAEQAPPAAQAPTAKSEDRVEQTADAGMQAAAPAAPLVTPHKVRTMVVKPDGTLVPREAVQPAESAAAAPADPAPQRVAAPGAGSAQGLQDIAASAPAEQPAKPAAKARSTTPAVAPVAPQRPSDQPVNVVGEVKPDQVASIDPGTAASGSWVVQIASQPTAESAQATYQDLARRYASVLQGRSASIVKADVAGKGTYYRVRVSAQSRNDAVALCTSYKSAGGNCFVSR